MQISSQSEDDVVVLTIVGDFDTTDTDTFAAEVSAAIDAGVVKVLLDLGGLVFINSTALGSLLLSQKRLSQYGGGVAATGANQAVEKTFKLLELDRKIPLFKNLEDARTHLKDLSAETVSATGEEVEFLRRDAEEAFGARPRRGRMHEIHEEGLTFSFENFERMDADAVFPPGAPVRLRFLLPLYHPTHVFKVESEVVDVETVGRETLQVGVRFTSLAEAEREAVKQYVKDLRLLKGEG